MMNVHQVESLGSMIVKRETLRLARREAMAAKTGDPTSLDGLTRAQAYASALSQARAWDVDVSSIAKRGAIRDRARDLVRLLDVAVYLAALACEPITYRCVVAGNERSKSVKMVARYMARRGMTIAEALAAVEPMVDGAPNPLADRTPGWVLKMWQDARMFAGYEVGDRNTLRGLLRYSFSNLPTFEGVVRGLHAMEYRAQMNDGHKAFPAQGAA